MPGIPFRIRFDLRTPARAWRNLELAAAGVHQAENAAVYLTAYDSPRARPPEELAKIARRQGLSHAGIFTSSAEAFAAAMKDLPPAGTLLVTGLFYLTGETLASASRTSNRTLPRKNGILS